MMLIDESRKGFELYLNTVSQYSNANLSESDTRSKIIDDLLISVLGWAEGNINREGHVESGYYDYIVSIPGIHFIVEAKKSFVEFTLPTHHKQVSINSIYNENREVINQIRGYSMDCGIPYGLISNGKQSLSSDKFKKQTTTCT